MELDKLKRAQTYQKANADGGSQRVLRCGEIVSRSGIYEAVHDCHEDGASEVALIALRGEVVRPCQICGDRVCLRLVYAAPHISEDSDFTPEPNFNN